MRTMRKPARRSAKKAAGTRLPGLLRRENVGLTVGFGALLTGLYLILIAGRPPLGVELGHASARDFVARTSFQCVDTERTEQARREAKLRAPIVVRSTGEAFEKSRQALLAALRQSHESAAAQALESALRDGLRPLLGPPAQHLEKIEAALDRLVQMPLVEPSSWEASGSPQAEEIILRDPVGGQEKRFPAGQVVLLSGSDPGLRRVFEEALEPVPQQERAGVLDALAGVLSPTMAIDPAQTLLERQLAVDAVQQVMTQVPKDTLMLAQGTEVTREHLVELEQERRSYAQSAAGRLAHWQRLIGLAVALGAIAAASLAYVMRFRPELARGGLQGAGIVLVTLALTATARLFALFEVPMLLLPLPAVVMVFCLVYDQRFGFETAVLYGLLVGVAHGMPSADFMVVMIGAMVAALLTGRVRTRSTFIRVGLLTGLSQWAAAWGLGLLVSGPVGQLTLGSAAEFLESARALAGSKLFADSICALVGGIMSGFLVGGLLPVIERLFGVTTDIRLLECSDPNQPLLQRLLLEAPGTYHHSMMVGSLAADAAEAIGANPLLARVSAYFHDVGKLKKPRYFAENLPENQTNPHEDLSPTMSSLILTAHPRDGSEMAEQYGLPREVRDIVLESHGSTVTKYFWGRAKERSSDKSDPQEATFRYRAPKPHSKEAACVMLADAAESAARSLESASPGKMGAILHEIILDRLHDGQLNESNLTLTDLDRIEKSLVRSLNAVFHNRVSYPGQEEGGTDEGPDGEDSHTDSRPAEQA